MPKKFKLPIAVAGRQLNVSKLSYCLRNMNIILKVSLPARYVVGLNINF